MAVTPLKIFLFLFGCTAAAGAVAYGTGSLDPLLGKGAENVSAVAALPEPAPSDQAAPRTERVNPPVGEAPPNTMAAVPPTDAAATPPADAAANPPAGPQLPVFDIVRVETDGSLVIAGKAMADALVELLNGEAVLGSAKATPEGDFAIVLDNKLTPGDYQLTLRATPPGGAAVASLQTAVISVPDKPGGQVLAMVEQPGQATDILTVPQPPAPAEAANPPAGEEKPAEVASAPAEEKKPADVASAPAEATPPAETLKTEGAAQPADVAAAPAESEKPAEPAPVPTEAKVAVEAIEIDGGKIFVAGSGEPGRFVRVYANEIVLGETKVGGGGRFLIEAKRDLPVGNYIIRADLLDADGIKVIARAAVPFEREPGESIAAVAPGVEKPAEKPADTAAAEPEQPADAGKPADMAAADQASPPADEQGDTSPPAAAAETPPPAAASPEPKKPAVAAGETPPAAGSAGTNPPADAAAEAPPATTEPAPAVAGTEQPPTTAEQPAAPAEAAPPAAGTDVAAAPPETVSPKLQKVGGAVIIRRSDTLWRISRRVYGRGIRYWTIYLANQSQISDPNRIWPGQIFRVPEKSKEGEAADMSAMGKQMTTIKAE